ncbi:MAG: 2-oxo acid dehydrogenase subunit E2 [Flavobacteriaceae bacterium]
MATVINMPRLSDTMTEGTVATWLKNVGDRIEEGDILAEIETDKATMEFESFNEGTLLYIGVQEGDTAPVDSLLAIIGDEGENVDALVSGGSAPKEEAAATEKQEEVVVEQVNIPSPTSMPTNLTVVTMPRLSDTMTEGTVASWLKNVGDKVEEGDILAEIETDKATMEFESFNEGTLLYVGLKEGESAPVDSILAVIGEEGADVEAALTAFNSGSTETATEVSKPETQAAAPAESQVKESAPTQTAVAAEVVNTGRIIASPLAKKIAAEKGINLATVKGTGDHGRIVKKDVEFYNPAPVAAANTAAEAPVQVFAPAGEISQEEVKNSQMRKTIARRLGESKFTAPHYYLTIEINMDGAIESRKAINNLPDTKVSFNDLVVKASAMALKLHPQVNTQWTEANTIVNHHISIGVAVAVEDGLVVPVIPFTDQRSLTEIGASVRELAGKAKSKKLQPKEMEGSTFTVSNLGMFGISEFTSIINQPNSAILSVGAISQQPIVKDGAIVVGNVMKVTLACDHRTVDGATGAAFLQTLKSFIENPVTMLA